MAQAINKANDEKPSVTHSDNKENCDETSVSEDSYTLEHQPDDTEYMIPFSENTKLWQSTLDSDKSELNMIQMIPTQFSLRLPTIETQDEFRYISTRDYVKLWDDRNIIYHEASGKCYQFHNATNSLRVVDVEHCQWELGSCCARTRC